MIHNPYIDESLRTGLLAFAQSLMSQRPPDFVLGGYMERWRLGAYGDAPNAYIHRFRGDDDDRALHDHPYDNVSVILAGSYNEHFHVDPFTVFENRYLTYRYLTWSVRRHPGQVINRKATDYHRLTMVTEEVISLFIPGPRVRRWGFLLPDRGWVDWEAYEKADAL